MHKLGAVLVLAAALVLPVTASADKPIKSPSPFGTVDIPAGVVCPFEMLWESPVNKNFQNVHLDKAGNVRWIWGGGNNVARITNEANGKVFDDQHDGAGEDHVRRRRLARRSTEPATGSSATGRAIRPRRRWSSTAVTSCCT